MNLKTIRNLSLIFLLSTSSSFNYLFALEIILPSSLSDRILISKNSNFISSNSSINNQAQDLKKNFNEEKLVTIKFSNQKLYHFQSNSLQNDPNIFSGVDPNNKSYLYLNNKDDQLEIILFSPKQNYHIRAFQDKTEVKITSNVITTEKELTIEVNESNSSSMYNFETNEIGNVIVKVLVLYSSKALGAYASLSDLEEMVQSSFEISNHAFANSEVKIRLQMAGVEKLPSFTESISLKGVEQDLLRLKNDPAAKSLKTSYNADIVTLIGSYNGIVCGIASVITVLTNGNMDKAYNIVDEDCSVLSLSFSHEIGHNLGLRHDRFVDIKEGAYKYSHGFVNAEKGWRTILAYNRECTKSGFNCTRIPYFSSASLDYLGGCLGNENADNQRSLNNIRFTLIDENLSENALAFGERNFCQASAKGQDATPEKDCLLSDVAFGTELYSHLDEFRNVRDQYLKKNEWGKQLIRFYYQDLSGYSKYINSNQVLRFFTLFIMSISLLLIEKPIFCIFALSFFIYLKYRKNILS